VIYIYNRCKKKWRTCKLSTLYRGTGDSVSGGPVQAGVIVRCGIFPGGDLVLLYSPVGVTGNARPRKKREPKLDTKNIRLTLSAKKYQVRTAGGTFIGSRERKPVDCSSNSGIRAKSKILLRPEMPLPLMGS